MYDKETRQAGLGTKSHPACQNAEIADKENIYMKGYLI
jgi:hypothetical protein